MSYKEDYRKDIKSRKRRDKLYWKPEQGENTIRVLPSFEQLRLFAKFKDWKKALSRKPPFTECLIHRNVGPKDAFVRCVGCGLDPEACEGFLCRKIQSLQDSGSRAKQSKAEEMKPSRETLFWVASLNRDTNKFEGPFLWELGEGGPKSMWYSIIDLIVNKKRFYEHPLKGFNLSFEREGTGMQTRYTSPEVDEDPSKVSVNILKRIKPWDQVLTELTDAQKKALYLGQDLPKEEEFDDDDEEEDSRRRKRKKKKKVEDEDEDDLEDLDEEDEDEDEDDEDDEDEEDE